MSQLVLDKILESKIIAIVRGISSDKIINLVQAMLDGGICCVEVTFDQTSEENASDTLLSISKIKEHFGEKVMVGAGTVLTVEQVHRAVEAGAEYLISPNTDIEVIRETKRLNKVSIPGALTPSEVVAAYNAGADIIKLFPAGLFGEAYIKAIKAPLKHIPIAAVGGITPDNIAEFLKAGAVGAGVGGNLVSPKLVNEGKFDEITATAKQYVEAIRGV